MPQAAEISGVDRRGSLDLNSDDAALPVLKDRVHFDLVLGAVVE
jgi:hypothetical protein